MVNFRNDLYPFTGTHRRVNGFNIHLLDEGKGESVVLLHGNPTWSFYYRNLVLGLRADYRVIAPDHIGCGLSDKPSLGSYNYTLKQRVEDLSNLINQLGIEGRITLVMHDWGGMIGMAYATRFPEKIAKLVLLNTAAFHLPNSKSLPASLWLCRNTSFGDFLIRKTGIFPSVLTRWCVCKTMDPRVREGYLSPYQTAGNRTGLWQFVKDIPLLPADPAYALVSEVQSKIPCFRRTPTLILWGEKDFVFDHHFLKEWENLLPNAQVHRFPNAGHYVLEDAGVEILGLLRSFLSRPPSHA